MQQRDQGAFVSFDDIETIRLAAAFRAGHSQHSLVRVAGAVGRRRVRFGHRFGRQGRRRYFAESSNPHSDPTHRIVFHYTPKHSSWLNQIEIWLSILTRKLLKRASFTSVDELVAKVLEFIHDYNQTMAKPFQWTYEGKPLTV